MPTKDELRRALKAFKKRLKLARRDDESGLGVGPLSGGKRSGIIAVTPPDRFPPGSGPRWSRRGGSSRSAGPAPSSCSHRSPDRGGLSELAEESLCLRSAEAKPPLIRHADGVIPRRH